MNSPVDGTQSPGRSALDPVGQEYRRGKSTVCRKSANQRTDESADDYVTNSSNQRRGFLVTLRSVPQRGLVESGLRYTTLSIKALYLLVDNPVFLAICWPLSQVE